MSVQKMRLVPDDVLTFILKPEASHFEKELASILQRNDYPSDVKLKMYEQVLHEMLRRESAPPPKTFTTPKENLVNAMTEFIEKKMQSTQTDPLSYKNDERQGTILHTSVQTQTINPVHVQ